MPQLDAYFGVCFDALCREALRLTYEREGVSALFEAGPYWNQNCLIDVVGLRDGDWIDLGKCKPGQITSSRPSWKPRSSTIQTAART